MTDEHGRLVGIVSEGDFLHRAEIGTARRRSRWIEFLLGPGEIAESYVQSHGRKVGEVMTRDVVTAVEGASLTEIVEIMEKRRVKRLPVVSGDHPRRHHHPLGSFARPERRRRRQGGGTGGLLGSGHPRPAHVRIAAAGLCFAANAST